MNMHNKKTQRIISTTIIVVLVLAMLVSVVASAFA